MADRELLELAAKAAGYPWRGWTADENGPVALLEEDVGKPAPRIACPTPWNPLKDDGDALRLAVKLKLHLGLESHTVSAWESDKFGDFQTEVLRHRGDEAATRRAIVRAAAEIGKAMP